MRSSEARAVLSLMNLHVTSVSFVCCHSPAQNIVQFNKFNMHTNRAAPHVDGEREDKLFHYHNAFGWMMQKYLHTMNSFCDDWKVEMVVQVLLWLRLQFQTKILFSLSPLLLLLLLLRLAFSNAWQIHIQFEMSILRSPPLTVCLRGWMKTRQNRRTKRIPRRKCSVERKIKMNSCRNLKTKEEEEDRQILWPEFYLHGRHRH